MFLLLLGLTAALDMRDADSIYDAETRWSKFKTEMEKEYATPEEEASRFEIFKTNLQRIKEHNEKNLSYWFKVTPFADMTPTEFKEYTKCGDMSNFKAIHELSKEESTIRRLESQEAEKLEDVDWVALGKVTPVKNQGQCGSCWSFSAVCSMESRAAVAGQALTSLSEQQLVDCSVSYGNHGCNGGSMMLGFEYAQQAGGLCSEDSYPYKAADDPHDCSRNTQACGKKYDAPRSYGSVAANSPYGLQYALRSGPVSVAIEADQQSFQLYGGGVFDGRCGSALDHGVVVVGFGTDSDGYSEYWKVRNSWGAMWGEGGYIRLCRDCNKNGGAGQCGVLSQPVYPIY